MINDILCTFYYTNVLNQEFLFVFGIESGVVQFQISFFRSSSFSLPFLLCLNLNALLCCCRMSDFFSFSVGSVRFFLHFSCSVFGKSALLFCPRDKCKNVSSTGLLQIHKIVYISCINV